MFEISTTPYPDGYIKLKYKEMIFFNNLLTVSLTLFAVIDIIGSIPVLIDIKKKQGHIQSEKVTIYAMVLMVVFLLLGDSLLKLIGIDVESFAIAGALVIFIIGLEMILGIEIMKPDKDLESAAIVPIAFPLIAGAGTITTIISLKASYSNLQILLGILINLIIVYVILKLIPVIEGKIGKASISVLRRIFGVLLIAIAVKIFTTNIASIMKHNINF